MAAIHSRTSLGLLLIFLALAFPQTSQAQTAADRILSETARLEKLLQSLKLSDDEKRARSSALLSVRQTLQAGNLYLSLYRLQPIWVELVAQEYAASKASIEAKGADAFEQEWQRLKPELDEKEKRLNAMATGNSPAVIDALVEASLTQVRPYYQSGRLYGLNTTIQNGLFYMGLAPAHLDFSIFCRGLRLERKGKTPKFRSLKAELSKLEAGILETYRRMDSPENQVQFIRINSSLKMAVELDVEGRFTGSLLRYLDTTLFLHLLTAQPLEANALQRLLEQSRLTESRLKKGDADHSIGLIYLESAKSALEDAARGQTDAERVRRAGVILNSVLPSYFEIVSGDK